MLSLFPSLLSWSEISPLLIRLTLAAVFLYASYTIFKTRHGSQREKTVGIVEGLSGIFLAIGLWTQAVAMVLIVDLILRLSLKIRERAFLSNGINYYLILLIMAISLLFTGPGIISLDFPL